MKESCVGGQMIPAKLDQFGHVVEPALDSWGARRGVALALRALAPSLPALAVPRAMTFFVQRALADRHDVVRDHMLNAAMAIVDLHGKVPPYTPSCRLAASLYIYFIYNNDITGLARYSLPPKFCSLMSVQNHVLYCICQNKLLSYLR